MSRTDRYFADTTIVYYRLHGHDLQKQAIREATGGGTVAVSNFIRGEYIRGFVRGLIDLYAIIKEENAVTNGIQVFVANMGGRPRKLANALLSLTQWFCGLEDSEDVNKTLRRLGEYIRGRVYEFDMTFVTKVRDPLNCELGILSMPQETYDESQIFEFLKEFDEVSSGPTCDQCEFRESQKTKLSAAGVDLYSTAQREAYAEQEGYVAQARWAEKAVRSPKTSPSCWYCDRVGDTIIALSAPATMKLLTGDKHSFPALASILGKSLEMIPSLIELRARRDPE